MKKHPIVSGAAGIVRPLAAGLIRQLPPNDFKGRGRVLPFLQSHFVNVGNGPLVVAHLRLGYTILVDLRSHTECWSYWSGDYDMALVRAAQLYLRDQGAVALDVGANVGFWCVPLAQRAKQLNGSVVAFEPLPANVARLRENIARNHVSDIVKVFEVGLSESPGSAILTLSDNLADGSETGNAYIVAEGMSTTSPTTTIELRRLDDLVEEIGLRRLDLIKVDIEGHEDLFFSGAMKSISEFRPTIFSEWSPAHYRQRNVDPTLVIDGLFEGLDYEVLTRRENEWSVTDRFWSPSELDDLLLVPKERTATLLRYLSATQRDARWGRLRASR